MKQLNENPKMNAQQVNKMLKRYTNITVSLRLEISVSEVELLRAERGIPEPNQDSVSRRIYNLNQSFFKVIDTEEKAYILGFLAADGNINPSKYSCEIRIVVHPQDADILFKINKAWGSTYPVRTHMLGEFSGFPGSNKEQRKLSVTAPEMAKDLAVYGIVSNKTDTVRFPRIPDHLERHFLRGFLDGDGHVSKEYFGWTCNHIMANDIQWICLKHGFGMLRKYTHTVSKSSSMLKGGPSWKPILDWIYEDATIFLNRKKEHYDLWWKDRPLYKTSRVWPTPTASIPCDLSLTPPDQIPVI